LFIPHINATYPDTISPVAIQGWTLNYEIFFYALFAIAILFGSLRIWVLLVSLAVLPLILQAFLGGSSDIFVRFYGNDIILEFGFGVLLQRCVATYDLPHWSRATYVFLVLLGFGVLAAGCDSSPRSIFDGLPALLIVWCSLKAFDGWLRFRLLAMLGSASYSIYLFHWASFGAVKPAAQWIGPTGHISVLMAVHVFVAVAAGIIIHLVIEKRLTKIAQQFVGVFRAPSVAATGDTGI
jgi:exopolysaccharide production protein ExoZ